MTVKAERFGNAIVVLVLLALALWATPGWSMAGQSATPPTTTTTLAATYDGTLNLAQATVAGDDQSGLAGRCLADALGDPVALSGEPLAPRAASGAESAAQGARLREHLRLSERYGAGGVRELPDDRIRYYGELRPANKPGEMAGLRVTREWDPATGNYRTWMERLDHSGRVRQVHPYQPYSEYHYMFDEFDNYVGRR